jgi:SOS response regulatory protein OraA/RecX
MRKRQGWTETERTQETRVLTEARGFEAEAIREIANALEAAGRLKASSVFAPLQP